VMENLTGPAGTLAGLGSQPASDSAIFTAAVGPLGAAAPDPPELPQPASNVAAQTSAAAPASLSARIEVMRWCLSSWFEHRRSAAIARSGVGLVLAGSVRKQRAGLAVGPAG